MTGRVIDRVRSQQAVAQQNKARNDSLERQRKQDAMQLSAAMDEVLEEHLRRWRSPWRRALRSVFRG